MNANIPDDGLKHIGTIFVKVYRIDLCEHIPARKQPLRTECHEVLQGQRKIQGEKLEELNLTSLTHSTRYASFDFLSHKNFPS